jgi:Flp pilus assembly protein TadG
MTMRARRASVVRSKRHGAHGQALAIFALLALFLFAVTGLAVDAGLSYLSDNGAERAAAAGALAGVPYMPNGWNGNGTCASGGTANSAACSAAKRNGFNDGATRNGHTPGVTVSVSRYPAACSSNCDSNKLTVTVTAWVSTTFMRVLGIGDHQVTATETAFYLSPISLGQPGAQLGSSYDQLGTANNFYFLRSEGYGTDRGQGDAFTPNPTNGTTGNPPCDASENQAGQGTSTDIHQLNSNNGTEVPASTMASTWGLSWNSLPARGGYNYAVTVPSTVSSAAVRVYNPAFSPDGGYSNGATYNMHEQDSWPGNSQRLEYSAMMYTIFQVTDIFDHTQDKPIAQVVVDPINAPGTAPGSGTFTDMRYSAQPTIPTSIVSYVYHSWVDVGNPQSTSWSSGGNSYTLIHTVHPLTAVPGYGGGYLTPGTYRVRFDMLDYQGNDPTSGGNPCSLAHKGSAVQLSVPAGGGTYNLCSDTACNVAALNDLGIYTPINGNGSGFDIPIFQLPKDYAGKQVFVYVYDPGDLAGSGTNSISLVNPDTGQITGSGGGSDTGSVNIYDLGVSINTQPANANLVNTLYSCTNPMPTANKALVNTVVDTSGCSSYQGSCTGANCNVFNEHWVLFALTIPAGYTNSSGNYWKMRYSLNGTANDTVTIVVNYGGSPVHLI